MFPLVVGWVGSGQSADGLGWIGSYKMDPWTTLLLTLSIPSVSTHDHTASASYPVSDPPGADDSRGLVDIASAVVTTVFSRLTGDAQSLLDIPLSWASPPFHFGHRGHSPCVEDGVCFCTLCRQNVVNNSLRSLTASSPAS